MTLHVQRRGHGPDLAMLHGWGLGAGVWETFAPRLEAHYRVHVVELPGYGRSRGVRFGSLAEVARTVSDVLPDRCRLLGWSLGGSIALGLAAAAPARVDGMVLVATSPCFVERPGWKCGMPRAEFDEFADTVQHAAAQALRRFAYLNVEGGASRRASLRRLEDCIARTVEPDAVALRDGLELLREADLRGTLKDIRCPLLVLHGERDSLVPLGAARALAEAVPGATFVAIEKAAHVPFLSHPEACVDALGRFHA
jgi:pimeloyl-[acyl-carrier protein] methyl ester esterase